MTPVEWLVHNLTQKKGVLDPYYSQVHNVASLIEQAKEMEKQQMCKPVDNVITDGIVTVDLKAHAVRYKGEVKHLTKKIIGEISYLMANRGSVVTREELVKNVWEDDVVVDPRTVDVHITKIRKHLFKRCIVTIPRVGYKWN